MKSFQKSFLRSLGQTLRPVIRLGKDGLDEGFLAELNQMLDQEELVKVKFAAHKEAKRDLGREMAEKMEAVLVAVVGHNALLYRENRDPKRRFIRLPERPGDPGESEGEDWGDPV